MKLSITFTEVSVLKKFTMLNLGSTHHSASFTYCLIDCMGTIISSLLDVC